MRVDLHCHSNCSDGELSPQQLIKQAQEAGIEIFSITDHDTINAYKNLINKSSELKVISGIEFSTTWNKIGVHILALNFDFKSKFILKCINHQKKARIERAKVISKKLEGYGVFNAYESLIQNGIKQIGRPDFAKLLVKEGIFQDEPQAFKKLLGAGKACDIKSHWLDMSTIVESIIASGGIPVLAHPLKYKLTNSKLNRLIYDFKHYGGQAIEVLSGYQTMQQISFMSKICNKFQLLASMGSDFHAPSKWSRLGCDSYLLKDCDFVWDHFT